LSSPFEPNSARTVFRGHLLQVDVESWPAGEREIVRHPGACAIVALTPEADVVLVRQLRETVREVVLEIPAGIFDVEGEDGRTCAARELLEETGYRASNVERMADVYTSPGFTNERIELFLAEAEPQEGAVAEDDVELIRMPFSEALAMVRDGRIRDLKTVAGLLLAADRRPVQ
jgi:ADP-ribose pyrophosphatase